MSHTNHHATVQTMIRAIESRDLIMNEFAEDFFNEKSVKMTDLLREGAVYKPVQFPDRPSYNTPEYERNQIIGSSRLEAALYEYLHKGRRSEDNQDKQTTAIIGRNLTVGPKPTTIHALPIDSGIIFC